MNDILFRTDGTWDGTTLHNNGYEVAAAQLFIELKAGRDEWGDPIAGGIHEGADLVALVRPADDPLDPFDLLPGRITLEFPDDRIILENVHPGVHLEHTRVWYNGDDVTDRVVDLYVDINAVDNVTSVWITVYKSRWFRRDEVITHTIVG